MHKMLRSAPFAVLAFLTLSLTSCKPPEGGGGGENPPTTGITLAAIPKSTGGEFWETVEQGAVKAAADLGVELKWDGTIDEERIAEQTKIVESMINLDVDGIALAPLNRKAQKKVVQQAVDAGIPVVIFDSAIDGEAHASFVATDNKIGGSMGGEKLAELLGGQGKVFLMRFVQGAGSTEARAEGFMEIAKAKGLDVVADAYADTGTPEGCKTAAANTLERFVKDGKLELDGIFAVNLYATQGVGEALKDLQKSGIEINLKCVGFDTSSKLLGYLDEELIHGLVAQDPFRMGYLAVETLHKVVKGEPVDKVIDTGAKMVTKEGIANDPEIRKLVGLE